MGRAQWVGGVRCLGQSPKANVFFLSPFLRGVGGTPKRSGLGIKDDRSMMYRSMQFHNTFPQIRGKTLAKPNRSVQVEGMGRVVDI